MKSIRPVSGWLTAAFVAAGVGLSFAPADGVEAARSAARDLLRPGQALARRALQGARSLSRAITGEGTAERLRELEAQVHSLELENRRLELAGARLASREREAHSHAAPTAGQPSDALLISQLVDARLLGESSTLLLRGRMLIEAGRRDGLYESALVLDDARPLVDLGADFGLQPGDAVHAGRIILGKIALVGRMASTVTLVTDAGYSGKARLARRTSRGLVWGAPGTLVGNGSPRCQLKHVTEPANVGDLVYSGDTDGLAPLSAYYGRVVRAEPDPRSDAWFIEVEPAASQRQPETVQVLRMAMNPVRVAAE